MSRRLTEYEGFSVRRKFNSAGFNPFSDFFDRPATAVAPTQRSKDLVVLFDGREESQNAIEDPLRDFKRDLTDCNLFPLFPGACEKGVGEEIDFGSSASAHDEDLDMLVSAVVPSTESPFTHISETSSLEEKHSGEQQIQVPMVQPRDKTGQRLLYKYPSCPMVGVKGGGPLVKKEYYLLVGQSDKSETAWLLQFDGAANPNPGPASSGAVLWSPREADGKRRIVFEMGKFLGRATNNIAEAQGLLLGMKMAALRGARELLIEGDSELIVFQQIRKYQVKDKNLKVWWAETQAAMMDESSFDWIAIRQVPREFNERADSITKEVLQTKQGFSRE